MQFMRAQYRPPMPEIPMTMHGGYMYPPPPPPPMTPVVQWTNANGQMPNWFGPFMMSLMNFRRDILERMNAGHAAVPQPNPYHLETDDPEDGSQSVEDSEEKTDKHQGSVEDSEEETDKHQGTFTSYPLPYGGSPFLQSPHQLYGSSPYGHQQAYGSAPYQPYGALGPMPYGDYVPTHPKEMRNHKERKYHAGAEPEPEPYHAHETDYSHKESSEEESGEFGNRKVINRY